MKLPGVETTDLKLEGRTALVTGGGSGIGRAIADLFLSEGAAVAIAGIHRIQITVAEQDLARFGRPVAGYTTDIRQDDQVEKLVRDCVNEFGPIDILVNAAGVTAIGRTATAMPEDWYNVIETKLNGTYRVTAATLHLSGMIERGWGRIINIASVAGKQGALLAAAYTASKHGVVGLTRIPGARAGAVRCDSECYLPWLRRHRPGAQCTYPVCRDMGNNNG